ncbi:MAG: hypothetical protein SGI86_11510 [Deltaproteobacteria bacterium]|nr:hypothetical protein [Deltaproteobacteria bacterium]
MAKQSNSSLTLPALIATQIADVAARTRRSTAFIVLRSLSGASKDATGSITAPTLPLKLERDDDDPANVMSKIQTTCGNREFAAAIAGAWTSNGERFLKWADTESAAQKVEEADDLDAELKAAQDPATNTATLDKLASSAFPRVRALVAAHKNSSESAIKQLERDRETYVRDAVANRRLSGVSR